MIIRILPTQVPQLWEAIKFTLVQADEINKEDMPYYFNKLLHGLLNEKAQCFIRLSDDRRLLMLLITRIIIDQITGNKDLFIQGIYSWAVVNKENWQDDYNFVKEFAKSEQCKRISCESRNKRIWQLCEKLGFRENLRSFIFDLEV